LSSPSTIPTSIGTDLYNKLEDGQNGEDTAKWYPPKRRPETGGYVDVKMTAEMTADYIMIIWLVEMTAEMTAGRFC